MNVSQQTFWYSGSYSLSHSCRSCDVDIYIGAQTVILILLHMAYMEIVYSCKNDINDLRHIIYVIKSYSVKS